MVNIELFMFFFLYIFLIYILQTTITVLCLHKIKIYIGDTLQKIHVTQLQIINDYVRITRF